MSTDTELSAADLIAELKAAALAPVTINGTTHLVLPDGYQSHDITKAIRAAQDAPPRKYGSVSVKDVDSLMVFATDQQLQASGYIYADPDTTTITAVFNDNKHEPGWRDFRAVFKAEQTTEFQRWISNNGSNKAKSQTEFAEFIEDNIADINGDAAQVLLQVATTIQATSSINFSSAKRLHDGRTQLAYTEEIDAKAGQGGALEIPKTFPLGLRVFKNGAGYMLTARLKYRLGGGAVKFWYELDRPERVIESAFADYVQTVREKSGYTVLIGAAPSATA